MKMQMIQTASASFENHAGDFLDGLNHSGLVVSQHHPNQDRVFAYRVAQSASADQPASRHWKISDSIAGPFKRFARRQHSRMFDLSSDDVAPVVTMCLGNSSYREVIRFRP